MLSELLILAVPVVLVGVGAAWAAWDDKRWEARTRAAAHTTVVRPFPHGAPTYPRPLDIHAGRAVRKSRHARGVTR